MWGKKRLIDGAKKKKSNQTSHKRRIAQYKSTRTLLAREYLQDEKPDYDKIFDFTTDENWQRQQYAKDAIRRWVREGLIQGLSYDDIKRVVISEFRLHRDAMEHRKKR